MSLSKKNEEMKQDKLTVLAVDDQPVCLAILEQLVKAQGFSVDIAHDGREALALWQSKRHATIITDCHMPHMDGFALTKAIRDIEEKEQLNKSTIIALTANTAHEETESCFAAGVNEVLTKPINNEKIEVLFANTAERLIQNGWC